MGPRTNTSSEQRDAADGLAGQGVLYLPSAVPFSLSTLTSRISSYLFSE